MRKTLALAVAVIATLALAIQVEQAINNDDNGLFSDRMPA